MVNECPPELEELLKTLYNFSPQEATVLTYLCENEARIADIAEELGKDRSTVQRYISSLQAANLVSRRSVTTEKGKGRYFVYAVDKEEMKQKVQERLESWAEEKRQAIETI